MKNTSHYPAPARSEKGKVSEDVLTRYADVLLDVIFGKIFGTEENEDMLIALIEQALPGRKIGHISQRSNVQKPDGPEQHGAVFDVECIDADTGERFDVEIQRQYQPWFHERALYYSSFMIGKQLPKGRPYYEYPPVYVISLTDFRLHPAEEGFLFRYSLMEENTHDPMTDRLNFIFMELPNARGLDTPGISELEKTCYALHNMTAFNNRPPELEGKFYEKLFRLAEIANLAPDERKEYERAMTTERDRIAQMTWAKEQAQKEGWEEGLKKGMEEGLKKGMQKGMKEGVQKGMKEGMKEGVQKGMKEGMKEGMKAKAVDDARNLKALKVDLDIISQATGLDKAEIEAL